MNCVRSFFLRTDVIATLVFEDSIIVLDFIIVIIVITMLIMIICYYVYKRLQQFLTHLTGLRKA